MAADGLFWTRHLWLRLTATVGPASGLTALEIVTKDLGRKGEIDSNDGEAASVCLQLCCFPTRIYASSPLMVRRRESHELHP